MPRPLFPRVALPVSHRRSSRNLLETQRSTIVPGHQRSAHLESFVYDQAGPSTSFTLEPPRRRDKSHVSRSHSMRGEEYGVFTKRVRNYPSLECIESRINRSGRHKRTTPLLSASHHRPSHREYELSAPTSYSLKDLAGHANRVSKLDQSEATLGEMISIAETINRQENLSRELNKLIRDKSFLFGLLVNALSKWPQSGVCQQACERLARHLASLPGQRLKYFDERSLALLAQGFSKWPLSEDCQRGVEKIALHVRTRLRNLTRFDSQGLGNLVNGLSKWPTSLDCQQATEHLAQHIAGLSRTELDLFHPQHLSNLVNGFSKWPHSLACRQAAEHLAQPIRRFSQAKLVLFNHQDLSILVNGFSKWPDSPDCHTMVEHLAQHISRFSPAELALFHHHRLSTLVNGFSKWPHSPICQRITEHLALWMSGVSAAEWGTFPHQALSNLVNGFSKWPDSLDCQTITEHLAQHISRFSPAELALFHHHEVSNLVNGFSKWPHSPDCQMIAEHLAQHILTFSQGRLLRFNYQALSTLVNGFSKWPNNPICQTIIEHLAQHMVGFPQSELALFHHQDLSNLVNGFSKWPDNPICQTIAEHLAQHILGFPQSELVLFQHQALATLVNGFSKWPDSATCQKVTSRLARHMIRFSQAELALFHPQEWSNLVNGFSKWPHSPDCQRIVERLAQHISQFSPSEWALFHPHELANLVNGFSKWRDSPDCQKVSEHLAQHISQFSPSERALFHHQELSNLVNGFSKWPHSPDCQRIVERLAQHISRFSQAELALFQNQHLSNLVNGFSKWSKNDACCQAIFRLLPLLNHQQRLAPFSARTTAVIALALTRLIHTVESGRDGLLQTIEHLLHPLTPTHCTKENLSFRSTASLLKVLVKTDLASQRPELVRFLLSHATALLQDNSELSQGHLVEMALFLEGVFPLITQPEWRCHQSLGLEVLLDFQPLIAAQLANTVISNETRSLRSHVTYALYWIFKTYGYISMAAVLDKNIQLPRLKEAAAAIKSWVIEQQGSAQKMINADTSAHNWALIAAVEAEEAASALDTFTLNYQDGIVGCCPPAEFNVRAVLNSLDHPPRPPRVGQGSMELPVIDMRGKAQNTVAMPYTVLSRLTDQQIQPIAVKLPGKLSRYLLNRTVRFEDKDYRIDLFGGSKMKAERPKLGEAFWSNEKQKDYGQLIGIPIAETTAEASFTHLIRQLQPNQESFFYFQRMMLAQGPTTIAAASSSTSVTPSHGQVGHVLEGYFPLALLPDSSLTVHPHFELRNDQQQLIALRPHDGCGFIKASIAASMAVVQGAQTSSPYGGNNTAGANLPPQALQHYPRSAAVEAETIAQLRQELDTQNTSLQGEALFRKMTTGGIKGHIAIAVPSNDDRVHLPGTKSQGLTDHLLLGRAPYDKPNLRPIACERIGPANDPTASFLKQCTIIQYSFIAQDRFQGGRTPTQDEADEAGLFFCKGNLIVLPDRYWPAAYAKQSLILSAEDMKTHTAWLAHKHRAQQEVCLDTQGILVAVDIFPPGSGVAVPIQEQKKMSGDFDGDPVLLISGRPQLYQLVRQVEQQAEQHAKTKTPPLLKLAKTHTCAYHADGHYQFGRASQILATRTAVLENFSLLQQVFLAQPQRERLAQAIIDKIYTDQDQQAALWAKDATYIEGDAEQTVCNLLSFGIKSGTDAYKSDTAITQLEKVANAIKRLISGREFGLTLSVPYGKGTARRLQENRFSPEATAAALATNPTLAAGLMSACVKLLQQHGYWAGPRESTDPARLAAPH